MRRPTTPYHDALAGLEQISKLGVTRLAERVRAEVVRPICEKLDLEYFSSEGCFFFVAASGAVLATRDEAMAAGLLELAHVLDLLQRRVGWGGEKLGALIEQACPRRELVIGAAPDEAVSEEEDRWVRLDVAIALARAQDLDEEFEAHFVVVQLSDEERYEGDDRSYHAVIGDLQHRAEIALLSEEKMHLLESGDVDGGLPWRLPESSHLIESINTESNLITHYHAPPHGSAFGAGPPSLATKSIPSSYDWLAALHWAYGSNAPGAEADSVLLLTRLVIYREVRARRGGFMDSGLWWVGEDGALVRPIAHCERLFPIGTKLGGLVIQDGAEAVARAKAPPRLLRPVDRSSAEAVVAYRQSHPHWRDDPAASVHAHVQYDPAAPAAVLHSEFRSQVHEPGVTLTPELTVTPEQ